MPVNEPVVALAIDPLLDRLRRVTKDRRIPVIDFFKGFDALKVKRINRGQFIRGLSSAALKVSPAELNALAAAFRSPVDPTHIEYERFADVLNEVFTIKNLQNQPNLKVSLPLHEGYPDRLGWHKEGLTPVERARVKEVLESLAYTCASEGIDFNFLLAGYDHHKVGAITRNNFTRAIYPLLRRETPKDAVLLARAYALNGGNNNLNSQNVAYKVIADHLQTYSESITDTHSPKGLAHPRLSANERNKIKEAIRRLVSSPAASADPSLVTNAFLNYDYHGYGLVTTHNFHQTLEQLWDPPLGRDEKTLMTLAYALRDGKQDYRVLEADFQAVKAEEATTPADEAAQRRAAGEEGAAKAAAVESIVAHRVMEGRLKLVNHFREVDRMHTGLVSRNLFHRILSLVLRGPLSDDQLDALAGKHHRGKGDDVDYSSFLAAVEETTHHTFPASSVVGKGHLNEVEKARLHVLLERIRYLISSQRALLRPSFEDFDRTREFHISGDQFMRVLIIFNLLPPGDPDRQLLIKAYQPANPLDARSYMVNYARFMADVDPTAYKLPRANELDPFNHLHCLSQSHPCSHKDKTEETLRVAASQTFLGGKDRPVEVLLKEIRTYVLRNRVALSEYLKEQDRLRQGFVTRTQLARALSRCGVRMTDTEVEAVAGVYVFKGQVDVLGKPTVAYTELLDEVDRVFAVKNLDKMPNLPAEKIISDVDDEVYDLKPLAKEVVTFTAEEERKLESALYALAAEIQAKRIELLYSFKDQDKQNRGYISANNFVRVISSANLVTSHYLAEVSHLLVRKFREIFSTGAVYVNYRAFLEAMRAINQDGRTSAQVKDTATFRFDQRKGAATPQLNRVQAPQAAQWQNMPGVSEDSVLKKIKKMTSHRRINLAEFLVDGDSLHLGEVSRSKFRSSLTRAAIMLEPYELDLLETTFAMQARPDKVSWKDFFAKLQATPLPPEAQLNIVGQSDSSPLMQLLRDFKARVAQRRIYMKPYFLAYDKSNSSQITFSQWASIMATLGFVLSEVERAMICQAFAVPGFKDYVNYREFLKRVDP